MFRSCLLRQTIKFPSQPIFVNNFLRPFATQPPTSSPAKRKSNEGPEDPLKRRIKASTKVTKAKIISRAKQKQLEEEYDELKDPDVLKKIEKIEKKHNKIYTNTEIADEDYVLEAGQKEFEEDEEELKEPVTRTEPAFDIKIYAKQLANAKSWDDLEKVNLSFTVDEIVEMLEDEGVDAIRVIDIQEKSNEIDYLILGTIESNRHRRAVGNYIYLQAKKRYQIAMESGSNFVKEVLADVEDFQPQISRETNDWLAIDCGDITVHLFSPETRKKYNLETFWEREVKVQSMEEQIQSLVENEEYLLSEDKKANHKLTDKRNNNSYKDSDSD